MPENSVSGTPGSALLLAASSCAPTKIMPKNSTALASSALPEPSQAAIAPASAGPDGARDVERHRAERDRARHFGRGRPAR